MGISLNIRFIVLGILVLFTLISLILLLTSRDRLYLFFFVMMGGYSFEAVSQIYSRFIIPVTPLVTTLLSIPLSIVIVLFVREYIVLKNVLPRVNLLLSWNVIAILCVTILQIPWIFLPFEQSASFQRIFVTLEDLFSMAAAMFTQITVLFLLFKRPEGKIRFLGILFLPYSTFVIIMMVGRTMLNPKESIGLFLSSYGDSVNHLLTVGVFTALIIKHLTIYHTYTGRDVPPPYSPLPDISLTPREREMIPLIVQGYQNKEIAIALGLSEKTIEAYLSALYKKTAVNNRTELAYLLTKR